MDLIDLLTNKRKSNKRYGQGCTRDELFFNLDISPRAIDRKLNSLKKRGLIKEDYERRKVYRLL